MDQIVKRAEREAVAPSIEAELGLDGAGKARRGRKWVYGLLLLALAGAGFYGWQSYGASQPQSVRYQTTPAAPGDLTIEITATGTLQPLTQVDISSELSGVVRSVSVIENQEVKKGDVLAELDTTRLQAEIDGARASVAAAVARVEDAKATLNETELAFTRASTLAKRGMGSDQTLDTARAARDRAKAAVSVAEANVAVAQAQLKQQETSLEKSTIYAPIDGVVLTRSVDPGQTVASSLQAPVLFVLAADLKKMELKAAIDEADIGGVKPEQKARFTVDAFPERSFDAEIRDIAYAAVTTDGVVTYDARLDVDNAELLLRPGMTATVNVITREAKDVLVVPSTAFRFRPPVAQQSTGWSLNALFRPPMPRRQRDTQVQRTDGSRPLYVLKDGQPEMVYVKPGASDGENTEIVSGLVAGDQVVTGVAQAGQRGQGRRGQ